MSCFDLPHPIVPIICIRTSRSNGEDTILACQQEDIHPDMYTSDVPQMYTDDAYQELTMMSSHEADYNPSYETMYFDDNGHQ